MVQGAAYINCILRKDGRWEGRYTAGYDPATGKRIYKNVLGKTQAETKEKLRRALEEIRGLDIVKAGQYTVGQWLDTWFGNYARLKVRPSSHQTYRGGLSQILCKHRNAVQNRAKII